MKQFHSELQERLTELYQAGICFNDKATAVSVGECTGPMLRIGKMPDDMGILEPLVQIAFIATWAGLYADDNAVDSGEAIMNSVSLVPMEEQNPMTWQLSRRLFTLFRLEPSTLTPEQINV